MSPILGIYASSMQPALNATSFESIATVNVGSGGASTVSFSSIPSTYKHLQVRLIARGDYPGNNDNIVMYFNSDSATTNYTDHRLRGDGASVYANGTTNFQVIANVTFTAGTAPVAGYEGKNFVRLVSASQSGTSDYSACRQSIEDVRNFAGKTVTVSFWAKASTGTPNIGTTLAQNFGSGGSATVATSATVQAITTSWARYSFTISVPSISGKTIGTNDTSLDNWIFISCGSTISGSGYAAVGIQNVTIDIWGVQVEAGSTATPFQTATGIIQGELAACQRYYWRTTGQAAASNDLLQATMFSTTSITGTMRFPVTMRTAATCSFSAAADFEFVWSAGTSTISGANIDRTSSESLNLRLTSTGLTTNGGGYVAIKTGTTKYLEASAEL